MADEQFAITQDSFNHLYAMLLIEKAKVRAFESLVETLPELDAKFPGGSMRACQSHHLEASLNRIAQKDPEQAAVFRKMMAPHIKDPFRRWLDGGEANGES